jgi:hypothetical protein
VIITAKDIARRRIKNVVWVVGAFVIVFGGVVLFHYQVMDLNVFWAKLMRKMPI